MTENNGCFIVQVEIGTISTEDSEHLHNLITLICVDKDCTKDEAIRTATAILAKKYLKLDSATYISQPRIAELSKEQLTEAIGYARSQAEIAADKAEIVISTYLERARSALSFVKIAGAYGAGNFYIFLYPISRLEIS